jgi:YHS domain-containing protein
MQMERNVLNTRKVLDQISSSAVAVKVNIDKHPELANRFGVDHFPTDVFIEPNGSRLLVSTGKRTVDEYAEMIGRMSTRYTDKNNALMAKRGEQKAPAAAKVASTDDAEAPVETASTDAMLRGYCPVTLWNRRKWVKGSPQFSREYKGQTYWMSSNSELKEFDENPGRYAPQLLGCDPVLLSKDDRAVPGNTRYGAFYDDELFLFSTDANRKQFKANPDRFIREKVVLNVDQLETVVR